MHKKPNQLLRIFIKYMLYIIPWGPGPTVPLNYTALSAWIVGTNFIPNHWFTLLSGEVLYAKRVEARDCTPVVPHTTARVSANSTVKERSAVRTNQDEQ